MAGNGNSGGQNRKPTAMKIMEGTDRADRLNPNEPEPELVKIPTTAPDYFEKEAKKEWDRSISKLMDMNVLAVADYALFEAYCVEYGRYVRLEKEIQREGEVIAVTDYFKGKDGEPGSIKSESSAMNPKCRLRKEAHDSMVRLAQQFGLTPVSRSRVSAQKKKENDPLDAI